MIHCAKSPYLVQPGKPFQASKSPTRPPKGAPTEKSCELKLQQVVAELSELQHLLFAFDHHALLVIFQALDAAGKDSTIRSVMTGINPAGCQVSSFQQPSAEELDHDFLWRTTMRLPERGRIGIFNRSYYEEVLVVRVHPELLDKQRLPDRPKGKQIWKQRYESIRDHEKHLARNGTMILKFWLNVSREEQRLRLIDRIDKHEKNWKFSSVDVRERELWDKYMDAYEDALEATSRPWAPWYAIPADDKPYMRLTVATIIVENLKRLDLHHPKIDAKLRAELEHMRSLLEAQA